mmetsp:Transcript_16825/g.52808  ORF Transcript_16825/g.52808 Transcript_16825/m.52808 type:complete len:307 (+) Transcript_16825:467-1387(+)
MTTGLVPKNVYNSKVPRQQSTTVESNQKTSVVSCSALQAMMRRQHSIDMMLMNKKPMPTASTAQPNSSSKTIAVPTSTAENITPDSNVHVKTAPMTTERVLFPISSSPHSSLLAALASSAALVSGTASINAARRRCGSSMMHSNAAVLRKMPGTPATDASTGTKRIITGPKRRPADVPRFEGKECQGVISSMGVALLFWLTRHSPVPADREASVRNSRNGTNIDETGTHSWTSISAQAKDAVMHTRSTATMLRMIPGVSRHILAAKVESKTPIGTPTDPMPIKRPDSMAPRPMARTKSSDTGMSSV